MRQDFLPDFMPARRTDGTLYVKDSPFLGNGNTRYCIKCCKHRDMGNSGGTIKIGTQRHWFCADHKKEKQ